MTTPKTSSSKLTSFTLGLALALGGALAFSACDDDDDGDSGGETAGQNDDGGGDDCGNADDGGMLSQECMDYNSCVADNCDDCLDACSDLIDCSSGCGCGDDATACQQDCAMNNTTEACTQCFLDQATCAADACSAELQACGAGG